MRQQAEALEEAGRALEQTAALVKAQAELFERTVRVAREPTEFAKAAARVAAKPQAHVEAQARAEDQAAPLALIRDFPQGVAGPCRWPASARAYGRRMPSHTSSRRPATRRLTGRGPPAPHAGARIHAPRGHHRFRRRFARPRRTRDGAPRRPRHPALGRTTGKPVGWVTTRGMLQWLNHDLGLVPASQAVTEPPTYIEAGATAQEAVKALSDPAVTHLLVTRSPGETPQGVVGDVDVISLCTSARG